MHTTTVWLQVYDTWIQLGKESNFKEAKGDDGL